MSALTCDILRPLAGSKGDMPAYRGYRSAQPPANGCDPFGVTARRCWSRCGKLSLSVRSMRALFIRLLAILCTAGGTLPTATAADRVARELLVLYTFERPTDDVIRDRSGVGEPLNLEIDVRQGLTFRGGRLIVTSSARLSSAEPARKIVAAVKQSNALTIEAWVKPQDARQDGPARIVTLSSDPGHRNFTLGQDGNHCDVRLRATSNNENGIPATPGPDATLRSELTHVMYTRDPEGAARICVNGKSVATNQVAGQLGNWGDDFRLSLANELTGDW